MTTALINGRVLLDHGFERGRAVLVEDGRIAGVVPVSEVPAGAVRHDLGGAMLVPGFIDTQVNGGAGVLFNDQPTVDGIAAIGAAHRRYGTTGFLPTLISDDLDKIIAAMAAVDAAIAQGVPGVLGIHVEGPFLNVERKGIHDQRKIREIDRIGMEILSRRGPGRTLVTLAPEKAGPGTVRALSDAGVLVAAGHTDASAAVIFDALAEGLRGYTHLFNAMSPLRAREPGTVGAALFDPRGWMGIIVDGRHVDPVTLKLALRVSPKHRFMLVTDAMPSVGARDKAFMLGGRRIDVLDGVCVDDAGTLAGSDLDMATAVRNCVEMLDLELPEAVAMASCNPAAFLGLEHELGRIAPGYRADLVLLDDSLEVIDSWIDGEAAGEAAPRRAFG